MSIYVHILFLVKATNINTYKENLTFTLKLKFYHKLHVKKKEYNAMGVKKFSHG